MTSTPKPLLRRIFDTKPTTKSTSNDHRFQDNTLSVGQSRLSSDNFNSNPAFIPKDNNFYSRPSFSYDSIDNLPPALVESHSTLQNSFSIDSTSSSSEVFEYRSESIKNINNLASSLTHTPPISSIIIPHYSLKELIDHKKRTDSCLQKPTILLPSERLNSVSRSSESFSMNMADEQPTRNNSPSRPAALKVKSKTTGCVGTSPTRSITKHNMYSSYRTDDLVFGQTEPTVSEDPFHTHSRSLSSSTPIMMNPFDDPSLIGDIASFNLTSTRSMPPTMTTSHSRHPSIASFDPLLNGPKDIINSPQITTFPTTATRGSGGNAVTDTETVNSLSDIAALISLLKPRKNTDQEEAQLAQENHRITLGNLPRESTGTDKSHRRIHSLRGKMTRKSPTSSINHGSSKSLSVDELGAIMDQISERDVGLATAVNSRSASFHRRSSSAAAVSMLHKFKNDEKLRSLTPTRLLVVESKSSDKDDDGPVGNVSLSEENQTKPSGKLSSLLSRKQLLSTTPTTPKSSAYTSLNDDNRQSSPISPIEHNVPLQLSTIDTSSANSSKITIRSSEQDPSPHQTDIPTHKDTFFQLNLCKVIHDYREIDQNFDFNVLTGLSRDKLEAFCSGNDPGLSPSITSKDNHNLSLSSSVRPNSSDQQIMAAHKPILRDILRSGDDVVVEGFFHEVGEAGNKSIYDTISEKSTKDRIEVAIFQSDRKRQFYVVYQGSADSQNKPIRNRERKIAASGGNSQSLFTINKSGGEEPEPNFLVTEDKNEPESVSVFDPFRKAYQNGNMERDIFSKLDELAESHPFFDVIFSGHSFGGVLAMLGSVRYAVTRPAIMVSCFSFGCPRVGALNFRYLVNSLPNLKMIRVVCGTDPWINAPESPIWVHAGHTIVINSPFMKDKRNSSGGSETSGSTNNSKSTNSSSVVAYKFGDGRSKTAPPGKFKGNLLLKIGKEERQLDHAISSYIQAFETVKKLALDWPTRFIGEEGTGVKGRNDENRLVV